MRKIVKFASVLALAAISVAAFGKNGPPKKIPHTKLVKNCEIGIECNDRDVPCTYYMPACYGKTCAVGRKNESCISDVDDIKENAS